MAYYMDETLNVALGTTRSPGESPKSWLEQPEYGASEQLTVSRTDSEGPCETKSSLQPSFYIERS